MADSLRTIDFYQDLEAEHRTWLLDFDQQYLRNWEKLLKDKEEAALAEARIRQILESYRVTVEPNESLTGHEKRPDFLCTVDGYCFEVEVTHISIQKAINETGIDVEDQREVCCHGLLNRAVAKVCTHKAEQCANRNHPTLLAVTTFHSVAAAICSLRNNIESLLTGERSFTWDMKADTLQPDGDFYGTTSLKFAAFLCPDKAEKIGYARCSISGLLFCGPGKNIRGVLHPNSIRPFNPMILPNIEFGQVVVDRESGKLRVDWPEDKDEYTA
jgi:hypothetical protein